MDCGGKDSNQGLGQKGGPFTGGRLIFGKKQGQGEELSMMVREGMPEISVFKAAALVHLPAADEAVAIRCTLYIQGMWLEAMWLEA